MSATQQYGRAPSFASPAAGRVTLITAPAGRPARARPPGRAQRAGSAGGQASRTTDSSTSAAAGGALDPIEDNSAKLRVTVRD